MLLDLEEESLHPCVSIVQVHPFNGAQTQDHIILLPLDYLPLHFFDVVFSAEIYSSIQVLFHLRVSDVTAPLAEHSLLLKSVQHLHFTL